MAFRFTLNTLIYAYHLHCWENGVLHLPLIEFTYNNSFHSSIGMAPFEALYGRRCRTSLCCFESGESALLGPDVVQETSYAQEINQETSYAQAQLR